VRIRQTRFVKHAVYPPGHLLAGTVYKIVRHLATGGMGTVYEVVDTTVEKRYVLKTLHPRLIADPDIARRMRDEAKSLAKLSHPNIVDVITAGATTEAQPMPFYVMERLVGQNLREALGKRGKFDFVQAYRIAIDVLDALDHAHEHSIVHRDVKPENIFLHQNANGTHTTKLLDFGIVRLLDRKASHTKGKFVGTLKYASPEQITGATIGPATDLYSLGLVLYEMIAGRGPFDDLGDAYAIGAAHAGTNPPRISHFVRGVSKRVERLLSSALAKVANERPRDAFSFAAELRAILREEEAKPSSTTVVNVVADHVSSTELAPETPDIHTPRDASSSAPTRALVGDPIVSPGQTVAEPHAPVSPIAPTLAAAGVVPPDPARSAPRRAPEKGPHAEPVRPAAGVRLEPSPAAWAAAAAAPGVARGVDRDAPTRVSPKTGGTRRMPMHDTCVDEPVPAARPSAEVLPPPAHTTGFGAEARTRPPERGVLWVAGAAAIALVAIGGAAAYRFGVQRGVAMQPEAPRAIAPALTLTASSGALVVPSVPVAPQATAMMTATPTATATPIATADQPPPSASATETAKPPPPRPKRAVPSAAPAPTTSGYSPPIGF
jgi:eukaryotic-like serine/threonine-protein kinase